MSLRIRYMGNKHMLAGDVASLVEDLEPERPFLDLFCGMCSVGEAVASSGRQVWGNDVQFLAVEAARCLMAQPDTPPSPEVFAEDLSDAFRRNAYELGDRFADDLAAEDATLADPTVDRLQALEQAWKHAGNDRSVAAEVSALAHSRQRVPYRLCTLTFAHGYFGLRQSVAIDSIRYAIDRGAARKLLSPGEARWARLALIQTASVVGSTPGHFAQYLHATTDKSLMRVVRQRRRPVWDTFLAELSALAPVGSRYWRGSNRVFRRNALEIWPELARRDFAGGIIYADPPYSTDHYSRYYHVLESLLRYDYPQAHGVGRYRPDRFVTPFSLKRSVHRAFETLFRGAASLRSSLILSYPANGLLLRCGGDISRTLERHFSSVDLVMQRASTHSTLGARHGSAANSVDELVWLASP